MTVDTTVNASGGVTVVAINNPGTGYVIGDNNIVITGGNANASITIAGSVGNVNPNLRLIDQAFGFDDVKLTGGANMTITRTADTGISFVATNTQNEYATSWVDSVNDVLLRLTESGAGSGTQDLKIVAGTNVTLTPSGANLTITATDTDTEYTAGTGLTLTGTVFSADVDATQADDDTVALSAIADRFYGVQLDNNTTVADAKLVVNIPWTDTMGTGFIVSADTNTTATVITSTNRTLKLLGGTNVTTVSDPNGEITINSTDQYDGTVTSVSSDTGFVSDRSTDPITLGNWMTIGLSTATTTPAFTFTTASAANSTHYINGLGDYVTFPTIFAGTVTNVACTVNGNAYTATVTAPTASAAITIAPQGDGTQYVNGAGNLATTASITSAFLPLAGGVLTGDLKISEGTPMLTLQDSTANKGSLIIFRDESNTVDATIYQSKGITDPTGSETYGSHIFQISNSVTPTTSLTLAADGSATFTGLVTGIAPTSNLNFATKKYVDDNSGDGDVTLTGTQTLTNKTLTTPVIDRISPSAGLLQIDGYSTTDGGIKLMCYNGNHGQILKSQPHSAQVTNTMLLPAGASSTLVAETTSTLAGVTGRGATTTTACSFTNTTSFLIGGSGSANLYLGNIISASSSNKGARFHSNNNDFYFDFQGDATQNWFLRDYDGSGGIHDKFGFNFINGAFTATGDIIGFGSPSDKTLKENIKPIESALDKAMKLQGVTFDWKKSDSMLDIKEDIGFIAQDVQKVLPELVRENENGKLSLRHQGITPVLLEAIKELKAEIEELKKQIK